MTQMVFTSVMSVLEEVDFTLLASTPPDLAQGAEPAPLTEDERDLLRWADDGGQHLG